jgi:hypothetical protein
MIDISLRTLLPVYKDNKKYERVLRVMCGERLTLFCLPIDVTWIAGLAVLTFTTPGHLSTSHLDSTVAEAQLFFLAQRRWTIPFPRWQRRMYMSHNDMSCT